MRRAASPASERILLAVGAALLITLGTTEAGAFCRTSACGNGSAQVCTPPQTDDCGIPLFWPTGCFGFSVHQDGSRQIATKAVEDLMTQAFAAWMSAPCADGTPSISAVNLGTVACNQPEYNETSGNANVIMFRDAEWPYAGQGNTLALTTVTFNLDNGHIYDTDLEVNGTSEVTLTTADQNVQYDLLSILTHEAGHMLGLSHSPVSEATMKIDYVPGDTGLRSLHQDDIDGICTAYPPGPEGTCDPTPRHGFASDCGSTATDTDGCSCGVAGRRQPGGALLLALACGIVLLRRRQSARR